MSLCHFCHGTDTATTKYQEIIIFISFFTWHRYSTRKQQIPCNNYLYVIFLMAPIEHNKIPGNNYLCHFPMAQIQHNKIPSNNDICIIFFHDTDFVTTKYQVIMISVIFLMAQIQHNKIPGNNDLCVIFPMTQIHHSKCS